MATHANDGDLTVTTEIKVGGLEQHRRQYFVTFTGIFPPGSIVEPDDVESIVMISEAESIEDWWESFP